MWTVSLAVAFGTVGIGLATAQASQLDYLKSITIVVDIRHVSVPVRVAVDVEHDTWTAQGQVKKVFVVPVKTYLLKQPGRHTLVVPVTRGVQRAAIAPVHANRHTGQIQLDVYGYRAPRLSVWTESDWVLKTQPTDRYVLTRFHLCRRMKVSPVVWRAVS